MNTLIAKLDRLISDAEACGVKETRIGAVANIRGRLVDDSRSSFYRCPPRGIGYHSQKQLSDGEARLAVSAIEQAILKTQA